ncbi:hypothetical protein GCM10007052_27270 [Halioglobus japonicus]|uniref:Glutathione S-transferase C-terminal domain-containing protein n=1 Tax=Halioglobus japonicus TaxID=930805 RepID=A0AAP8SMH2_9GAMM|nr:glutathione binding-like protein [Halioglobus japonicus]PLW85038.1 hypothetical protein C0029_16015 [Halioglobus japonicus]GHD19151.1 hypothetical protein GCM10007052_27270 [Halioglobus japonicus]
MLERELDWLDAQLADGRRFLVGDNFSRADISVNGGVVRVVGKQARIGMT